MASYGYEVINKMGKSTLTDHVICGIVNVLYFISRSDIYEQKDHSHAADPGV